MKQNKDTLVRLIDEYHQKVEQYNVIQADYHRLKVLESKIEKITIERTLPSEDVADVIQIENMWRSIVTEMGSNIAQMLDEGNGLHVEQEFVSNPFGGAGLKLTTQFKFIRTMGKNKI